MNKNLEYALITDSEEGVLSLIGFNPKEKVRRMRGQFAATLIDTENLKYCFNLFIDVVTFHDNTSIEVPTFRKSLKECQRLMAGYVFQMDWELEEEWG
jgi:hypothetical protein